MSELDNVTVQEVATETAEHDQDWYAARRTTPEMEEVSAWAQERDRETAANRNLKQALGLDFEAYGKQLDSLSTEEKEALARKDPDEILSSLDARAEEQKTQEKNAAEQQRQDIEQAEANIRAAETPAMTGHRKSMEKAYSEIQSLDERIAELKRLNEMRDDPTNPDWDDADADSWAAAREGRLGSFDAELQAAILERQGKLQEATLHQGAYHENARYLQPRGYSAPAQPIGQVNTPNGTMPLTQADIGALVQLERDRQDFAQRAAEAAQRYPDWKEAGLAAARAGVDVTAEQAQFIISLPNGPDVAYHLTKNLAETRMLAQMDNLAAQRTLINLSHRLAAQGASAAPRKTSAPKPPSPVGGGSSRVWDVNDESGDATEWMHRRNADLKRRGKL